MASPKQTRPDDKGKVRIRFMEVELEGSNETLLEGIRSITSTMPSHALVVPKSASSRLPPKSMSGTGSSADPGPHSAEEAAAEEDQTSLPLEDDPPSPPSRPKAPRTAPKLPEIVETLGVADEPMPLKRFCEENLKTPATDLSDSDRAIVVAVWLKEHRSVDTFGAPELFTCCKFMRWTIPPDLTAPMRYLKKERRLNSGERGMYTLSTLGLQHYHGLTKGA